MTTPGGGFKIAEAYVEVDLREDIERDARKVTRILERVLPDTEVIRVGLEFDERVWRDTQGRLRDARGRFVAEGRAAGRGFSRGFEEGVSEATPELAKLRRELRELRKAAKIKPTYEPEEFIDAMGRARVRYVKVSRDTGTFIGEVMSRNFIQTMTKAIRFPAVFGPLIAGVTAFASSPALLAIPLAFAKIAADSVRELDDVRLALDGLEKDIREAFVKDSSMLADPLIDATQRIGQQFEALRPQIRQVFSTLAPQIEHAADVLNAIAVKVMPAVVRAAKDAGPAVMGAFEGIYNLSDGVVRFLDNVRIAAPEAGQTFRTLGTILADVLEMLGKIGAAVTMAFGGQLWQSAEAVFSRLTAVIGNLVVGALPGLTAGLEVAATFMNAVLTVLQPLSSVMGSWIGTVLGVTIAVRGFSSALGAVAAAVNVLKFTPLVTALQTLALQAGNAGLALGNFTTRVTGSAAAGERVAAVTRGMVSGFKAIATNLPIVGTVVLGAAIAWDELTISADEATTAIRQGGDAAIEAVRNLGAQSAAIDLMGERFGVVGRAMAGVLDLLTTDTEEYRASLDRVGQAQYEAAQAASRHQLAVEQFGENSPEAKAAAEDLARANHEVERAQRAAELATRGHTQSLIDHQNQIMAMADADLAHRMAIHEQQKAREDLAKAIRDNGAASDEAKEAQFRLEQADLRVIETAGQLAREQNELATETERAAAEADAQRAKILELATSAEGRASPSVQALARDMSDAAIEAHNASVKTSGLDYEIRKLPDGREVYIAVETEEQKVRRLQQEIDSLRGKTIYVSVKYRYPVNINRALAGYGMAQGGLLKPMADGGLLSPKVKDVIGFANGGGATLTPMSGRFATVVPPNTWRVIGDNMRYPELFAPLDGSRRSLELIRAGAEAFGHALVPMPRPAPTPATAGASTASSGGAETAPRRSMGDVHVHVTQVSGSPAETGRMVALALRTVG